MNCSEEPSEQIVILLHKQTANSSGCVWGGGRRERKRCRDVERTKHSMTVEYKFSRMYIKNETGHGPIYI